MDYHTASHDDLRAERVSADIVAEHPLAKNAQSDCISTHRYNVLPKRAGDARQIISTEFATRRKLVSWRIHPHRLPSRRPCTPGRSSRPPSPTTCVFTLRGPDTQLADILGRLLAASRRLVGGRPFHLLGAQVRLSSPRRT
jgi:hypothetical protein